MSWECYDVHMEFCNPLFIDAIRIQNAKCLVASKKCGKRDRYGKLKKFMFTGDDLDKARAVEGL